MKQSNLLAALGLSVASVAVALPASAELKVGVGAANIYLDSGLDVSEGAARVFGHLGYEFDSGLHIGAAGSSYGQDTQEYQFNLGYSFDVKGVNLDAGVSNYLYPGLNRADSIADESEVYISASFKGATASYYKNIAGFDHSYNNLNISYQYNQFGALIGFVSQLESSEIDQDYTHLDLSYAVNDRLHFKLSKIIDVDEASGIDDDMLLELSLELPIEM